MPPTKNAGGGAGAGSSNRVDRRGLAQHIASRTTGLTENQVYELLGTFGETVTDLLQRGNSVALAGFGTWKPTERQARTGMDIRTKQPIQIPARRAANFTAGTTLKTAMISGYGGGRARTGGGGGSGGRSNAPRNTAAAPATAAPASGRGKGGRGKAGGGGTS